MKENIREGLPDAETGNGAKSYKPEEMVDPRSSIHAAKKIDERLDEENAGTSQNQELYARRDEPAPVEIVAPRAERSPHESSLRLGSTSVKAWFLHLSRGPEFHTKAAQRLIQLLAREIEQGRRKKREHENAKEVAGSERPKNFRAEREEIGAPGKA